MPVFGINLSKKLSLRVCSGGSPKSVTQRSHFGPLCVTLSAIFSGVLLQVLLCTCTLIFLTKVSFIERYRSTIEGEGVLGVRAECTYMFRVKVVKPVSFEAVGDTFFFVGIAKAMPVQLLRSCSEPGQVAVPSVA